MVSSAPVVGIVSLGEAGNLGDDLILAAAVRAVHAALPGARVRHLSFGDELAWDDLAGPLGLPAAPERVVPPRTRPWSSTHGVFADADVVLVGGGGLLQSTHHPLRPFLWLDHVPGDRDVPVIGVGLGLGPLSAYWRDRFRRRPSFFDELYVRDDASLDLARDVLGWEAERCLDFVDESFLRETLAVPRERADEPSRLGVSLRDWPGLASADVADHVQAVAAQQGCGAVDFFVLEAKRGTGQDVAFTREVAARLDGVDVQVHVYEPATIRDFVARMAGCSVAVGMKLHACAVWAASGTPVYPIVYAPKLAAFFGLPYEGIAVVGEVTSPSAAWHTGAPSAAEVLRRRLPTLVATRGSASRFTAAERRGYRAASSALALRARMRPAGRPQGGGA